MPPSPIHPADTNAYPPEPKHGGSGALFGTAIVVLLLIIAAFYFWGEYLNNRQPSSPPTYIPSGTTINVTSANQ